MFKEINVRNKEKNVANIIPLQEWIDKARYPEEQIIVIQKQRIDMLKKENISRAFELEILYHFIRAMGMEKEYQEFKQGYLLGNRRFAH